ncbi:MAG: AAA family ATPase [Erysipelotrichaceae bacterium]|nr:AAA family ATPase [Erysipelotrichaceae bacterium]
MKRIFGLVGYACNGKSTIIKEMIDTKDYTFIDLPQIYKNEAFKRGYNGVTEYYTKVGLKQYRKDSKKAVLDYIEKQLPRNENLIIDDIFDIDIYNKLIKIFPQMQLISFHSKYQDRLNRLAIRAGITNKEELIEGLNKRDNMKKYCGIEEIFPHCKYEITNKKDLTHAKNLFCNEITKNLIVCIVGYSGSGKSSLCQYISQTLNIPVFQYGKEVTKIINEAGFKKSREYVSKNGIESYDQLVKEKLPIVIEKFRKNNKFFILDGLVSDEILDFIKENNEVFSIYIKVPKDIRIKRLMEREKLNQEIALKEINTKDNIKISSGLDIVVSKCNVIVKGDRKFDSVIDDTIKLMETLGNK